MSRWRSATTSAPRCASPGRRAPSWGPTASPSSITPCATPTTWSRWTPTRGRTTSTPWSWAGISPGWTPSSRPRPRRRLPFACAVCRKKKKATEWSPSPFREEGALHSVAFFFFLQTATEWSPSPFREEGALLSLLLLGCLLLSHRPTLLFSDDRRTIAVVHGFATRCENPSCCSPPDVEFFEERSER